MLTAAALSVTVGVLIGIVLIIGSRARQSSTTAGPRTSSGSVSAVSGAPPDSGPLQLSVQDASDPAGFSGPETTSPVAVLPAAASTTPRPTTPRPVASRPTATRPATARGTPVRPSTTRPAIVFTTVTIAPPTSRSADPTTAPTSARVSTPTPTTPAGATTAPRTSPPTSVPNGERAAGQPCQGLGDKATAAGGNTLYCQTNFANGSLAWRAVVDGGGCLSKKMTGIGTDGRPYVCRPDRKGLDFWRRA